MKIRSIFITLLAVLILVFMFRGLLWQTFVSYEDIKEIPLQLLTDETLKKKIRVETENMDSKEIVRYCRKLTSDCLSFSMHHAEHDINKMYPQGKTHCVGYAAFFSLKLYRISSSPNQNMHAQPNFLAMSKRRLVSDDGTDTVMLSVCGRLAV